MSGAKAVLTFRTALAACFVCLLVGAGLAMIYGRTILSSTIIAFGGNTDKGDGNCGGSFKQNLIDTGQGDKFICQVHYLADTSQYQASINDGVAQGTKVWNQYCSHGETCEIDGFSQGSTAAIALQQAVGAPASSLYLYGTPAVSTGIWQHYGPDNPFVEGWLQEFGFATDQRAPAGSHDFYDTRDPYNNAAPQCSGPGLFGLSVSNHVVIPRDAGERVWTGPDGVDMHEANVGVNPVVLSGADPSPIWAGCPPGGWQSGGQGFAGQTGDNPAQLPALIPGVTTIPFAPTQDFTPPPIPGLP